jgi:hypothetical protein
MEYKIINPNAMVHTIVKNKIAGTFDIIRPPSIEDPIGCYLARRGQIESEMFCSFLNFDDKAASEFRNQFFLLRHLMECKD